MNKVFKPLLAEPVDFKFIDYANTWVSPKLDGIRAIIIDGVVSSRNLKPIRNLHVQKLFGNRPELEGFDGELIVGEPTAKDCYLRTNSGVMSKEGEPDVTFYVFDHITYPLEQYFHRIERVKRNLRGVEIVKQHGVEDEEELLEIEQMYLEQGYEGVMLREFSGPRSHYKFGRSTAKECTLLKLKRFVDAEAEILDCEEEMHNSNEATTNTLGRTERSAHQGNMIGKGSLGALVCKTTEGVLFKIGTGFDAATRKDMWINRANLVAKFVKYKSFAIGVKTAPRFPVFLGLRDPIDMSA